MKGINMSTATSSPGEVPSRFPIPRAEDIRVRPPQTQMADCPACAYHIAVPFVDAVQHPLATLGWPKTSDEAKSMKRLPLEFVRCIGCGHVYNAKFRYEEVPYSEKPNLMFNKGRLWSEHITEIRNLLLQYLPTEPIVVEIGSGDGSLLHAFAEAQPKGTYIGFDPNATNEVVNGVRFRGELFRPEVHVRELSPDLLISRHVLEHLNNPLSFLRAISVACNWANKSVRYYTEVPCIDRAFETGRLVDFYYEHHSHFTTNSFIEMLRRSGGMTEMLVHHYNHEVVSGIVHFSNSNQPIDYARESYKHRMDGRHATSLIRQQLTQLHKSGVSTAIWGGTGKAAAFMNYFDVDAERFPLVVDSDESKCGTFVPGTGQEIRFRDELSGTTTEIILIPMQWRARDIVAEIKAHDINFRCVMIEHNGRLIDFFNDPHPY